jgi:glutaredoxin-related protein
MKETIQVEYSCPKCGIMRRKVTTIARTPEENVVKWMNDKVATAVVADHSRMSPDCQWDTIPELYVPLNSAGESPIGSVVRK